MKFLLDQDVYAKTVSFLIATGCDVIKVSDIGLAQASDEAILKTAQEQKRILITRDRDYGNLVFVRSLGAGVIYLRISPSTLTAVHDELSRVIDKYSAAELSQSFVVIGKDGHRIRRLSNRSPK